MEVYICASDEEVGRVAAGRMVEALTRSEHPVMGLATGSSPLKVYADLKRRIEAGELDLSRASAFALDEYLGLPADHPQSYAQTIRTTVTEPLGLNPDLVHLPDGMAADIVAACADYEAKIAAAGGIDAQILGIGSNGHIGFNEPSSSFSSRTRLKTLTSRTREDNKRFFGAGEQVPTHCLTQGLGTIMDARRVVLVAVGAKKAEAVARAVEGPVSAMCPASILQFHPAASVVLDRAAASKLLHTDYYVDTVEMLPAWQRPV